MCRRRNSINTDRDDGNEGNEGDEGDEGNNARAYDYYYDEVDYFYVYGDVDESGLGNEVDYGGTTDDGSDGDDANEGNTVNEGDEGNGSVESQEEDYIYSISTYGSDDVDERVYGTGGDYVNDGDNGAGGVVNEGGQASRSGDRAEMGYFHEYADGTTLEDGPDIVVLYDIPLAVLGDYAEYGGYAAEA